MLDYLQALRQRPAWQHAPEEVKAHFDDLPPRTDWQAVYDEYLRYVLPYPLGNSHPRFWGWIAGTGTVMGAFAELLATAPNIPCGSFAYMSANYVEKQVLDWFKAMLGYPAEASGLLTSAARRPT
jgi:glutamate/tyrosine decarboxylase-like PLP-dependent enzyme